MSCLSIKTIFLPILLLFTLTKLSALETPEVSTFSLKHLRTVHKEDITGPLLIYESLAALTFEFRIPDWIQQKEKLLIYDQQCPTDEIIEGETAESYTCPIFYYLHQIRDQIHKLVQINEAKTRSKSINQEYNLDDCYENKLSSHFLTHTLSQESLGSYTSSLSKCVRGLYIKNEVSKEFMQSIKIPYAMMMSNFLSNYFSHLPSAGRVDLASLVTTATTYNTLGLMHFLAESGGRWKQVLDSCRARRIPSSLISQDMLQSSLKKLSENLSMKQMELVLPEDEKDFENLSHYFKEQLTDCVFTEGEQEFQTIFIRILIPIKRQGATWHYYRVRASPFIAPKIEQVDDYDVETSKNADVESKQVCFIKQLEAPKYFLVDKSTEVEIAEQICDPKESRFCLVRDRSESIENFRKSCVSRILWKQFYNESGREMKKGDENELEGLCSLKCEGVEGFELPAFGRIASDLFSIVGRASDSIVVQLDSRVKIVNPVETGLIQVTLPCQAVLLYKHWRFYARQPCGDAYKLVQVKL